MEVLLSAVASDLIGRLVSFLIRRYQEPSGTMNDVVRLQQVLLRAGAIVEEAEGRHITNRAILLQLSQLRAQMCRGSYVLDTFMRRAVDPSRRSLAVASRSRLPPGIESADGLAAAESLEAALSDMREFVVLLGSCPRLNRQPYSAYLFMESCMFGRQLKKEQIIGFLLQPARDLDVLPIIGPHDVGKLTLVEHACLDERVRLHFSNIHHLNGDDLDHLPSPGNNEHHQSLVDATARSLIVINLADVVDADEEEETWRRFHSSMRLHAHRESKIILISRAERHSSLGTAPVLRLYAPRREELWYLFKALAFGGADPDERPELVHIAVALFASIPAGVAPFAVANKLAASLRADMSARSWRRVLKVSAGATELELGDAIPGWRDRPEKTGFYYPSMPVKDAPRAPFLFYSRRKLTGVARSEVPKVTMQELLDGGGAVLPGGETQLDVLVWQSRIPPYGSYVATCDMETAQKVVTGKKRLDKRRGQRQDAPCN